MEPKVKNHKDFTESLSKSLKGLNLKINPKTLFDNTMRAVIVPMQTQIASRTLINILQIIDVEHIIRTGRYRNSIVPKNIPTVENPEVIIASVDCPYAHFLEFGTVKMQARHVFGRAIENVRIELLKTGKK